MDGGGNGFSGVVVVGVKERAATTRRMAGLGDRSGIRTSSSTPSTASVSSRGYFEDLILPDNITIFTIDSILKVS